MSLKPSLFFLTRVTFHVAISFLLLVYSFHTLFNRFCYFLITIFHFFNVLAKYLYIFTQQRHIV